MMVFSSIYTNWVSYSFLLLLFVCVLILYSFMGRSVIDFPAKTINDVIYDNENTLHWDKYAVVSGECSCLFILRVVFRLSVNPSVCLSVCQHKLSLRRTFKPLKLVPT